MGAATIISVAVADFPVFVDHHCLVARLLQGLLPLAALNKAQG